MSDHAKTAALHAVFHGRVQGVWFRGFTVRNARELGVSGWVRNRQDGTVEALFVGSEQQVAELVRRCRKGPPAAKVSDVIVRPCPPPVPLAATFTQRETV